MSQSIRTIIYMLGAENERRVQMRKQKLTVSLSPQTVQKAKALAAKRSTSVSELLTRRIEALVDPDEAYANAHRAALELMERGFHMGGTHSLVRQNLHSRC